VLRAPSTLSQESVLSRVADTGILGEAWTQAGIDVQLNDPVLFKTIFEAFDTYS
jgi:hypothetical protein